MLRIKSMLICNSNQNLLIKFRFILFQFTNRDDGKGAFGGSGGGASRGQGAGSNFDRGSQEQLGGLGRGGLNTNR